MLQQLQVQELKYQERVQRPRIQPQLARGQIWYAELIGRGSMQVGQRHPCIIFQNDMANKYSPTITLITCTSQEKNHLPTHSYLHPNRKNGLTKETTAMAETITTIDKKTMLLEYIGECTEEEMLAIDKTVLIHTKIKAKIEIETERENFVKQKINKERIAKMVQSINEIENILVNNYIKNDKDLKSNLKLQISILKEYCNSIGENADNYYQSNFYSNERMRVYA